MLKGLFKEVVSPFQIKETLKFGLRSVDGRI
jgi:hypothetical protein